MKPTELNNDEMKNTSGGYKEPIMDSPNPEFMAMSNDGTGSESPTEQTGHPISDGVGQTNESTYGTPDGPRW